MQKHFAVALATALVVTTASAGTAVAQNEITFDGLYWFDRNSNGAVDAGEPPAGWRGLRVIDSATNQLVAEADTNGFGRYSVTVPAGPEYRLEIRSQGAYIQTTEPPRSLKESATVDFGLRGGTITGHAFADLNDNGVHDTGEPGVKAGKLDYRDIVQDADGRFTVQDLGKFQHLFEAAENSADGYVLIDERQNNQYITVDSFDQPKHIDVRYAKPYAGNLAIDSFRWTPNKLTYVVGDQVEATFVIANRGDVVERPSFWLGTWADKILSRTDNFERVGDRYVVKDPLQPGQSVEITIRAEFTKPGFAAMNVMMDVSPSGEANTSNNSYVGPIMVDEA